LLLNHIFLYGYIHISHYFFICYFAFFLILGIKQIQFLFKKYDLENNILLKEDFKLYKIQWQSHQSLNMLNNWLLFINNEFLPNSQYFNNFFQLDYLFINFYQLTLNELIDKINKIDKTYFSIKIYRNIFIIDIYDKLRIFIKQYSNASQKIWYDISIIFFAKKYQDYHFNIWKIKILIDTIIQNKFHRNVCLNDTIFIK
jgi:hypothetical protein